MTGLQLRKPEAEPLPYPDLVSDEEQEELPVEWTPDGPRCDCGYVCRGDTAAARVRDAQRHAREKHGIEVTPEQVTS